MISYRHVDVFSPVAFGGNSLPVFLDCGALSSEQMLRITRELRHFEAIFVATMQESHTVAARVFDMFEELPFAGHPLIGAAAVLHDTSGAEDNETWYFKLRDKTVSIVTERVGSGYTAMLDQGEPELLGTVAEGERFAALFGLRSQDLHPTLPLEIVSTGLRYLIMTLRPGALERARVQTDLTEGLRAVGAQFAVLLDEAALEIRHWNNDGIMEDIATGSAAGAIGAYRLKHRLTQPGEIFVLSQGRFAGRPSTLQVLPEGTPESVRSVKVGGPVALVGRGVLDVLP